MDINELQQFATAQTGLITSLNKKINQLEQENQHLKTLLERSTPIIQEGQSGLEIYQGLSDEMAVCLNQIKCLRDKCINGYELTHEEARKLDIYTKLLISLSNRDVVSKPKPEEKLSDEEIIKQLEATIGK